MFPFPRLVLPAVAFAAAAACSSPSEPPPTEAPAPAEAPSHPAGHGEAETKPAAQRTTLLGNLGSFSRKIETGNAQAQRFFDEGLTLLYGFNHDEALRSFARAATLDDRSPMPHWGMALSLGTNINDPAPADRITRAQTHLAAAQARAEHGSDVERALVAALARRYVADPGGDQQLREQAYSDAMGETAKLFPADPDVATLYAESLMNLRPWRLYEKDGTPAPGTDVIVATLERVLEEHPNHPGANHYYVHAVEASASPARAAAHAERLETLVPGAGHLVHMPAHIYMRTGEYARSAKSNADAARVDEQYFRKAGRQGMYPAMYYGHNLQFQSAAAMFAGRYKEAMTAARKTAELLEPIGDASPMLEPYALQESWVALRFGRWEDAAKVAVPAPTRTMQFALAQYVRAAAHAEQGQVAEAEQGKAALQEATGKVPEDLMISATNRGRALLEIAAADLDGRIAMAKKNVSGAVAAFTRAVDAEDRLFYNEPPDWLLPERERLGAAMLRAGRADTAESVFRKDLEHNVGNPRSLFGLWKALDAQKKPGVAEAQKVFDASWKGADVTLESDLLGKSR